MSSPAAARCRFHLAIDHVDMRLCVTKPLRYRQDAESCRTGPSHAFRLPRYPSPAVPSIGNDPVKSAGSVVIPRRPAAREPPPPSGARRVMGPVRGQIRFAMAPSSLAALPGVGFLLSPARAIRRVGEAPRAWPLDAVPAACRCRAGACCARLASFGQSHRAAFRLETVLRRELVDHVARVSLGTLQQTGAAALAEVVRDDVKALQAFVADSRPFYARALVAPLAMLAALSWLDWRLARCVIAMIVAGAACCRWRCAVRSRSGAPATRRANA
ncbi:ABC transporter transmembrane domain-containing protein [Burkholderia plantarii]|nr:ABC transporter transmembrane domain-containing protein [Burkholderia plantarii]